MSLQCEGGVECRLQFGMEAPTFTPLNGNRRTIISRGISTVPLTLSLPATPTTTDADVNTTESIAMATTTTTESLVTTTSELSTANFESSKEDDVLTYIMGAMEVNSIYDLVSVLHGDVVIITMNFILCRF